MSFGPLQFRSKLTAEGLKDRWGLIYAVPIALTVFLVMTATFGGGIAGTGPRPGLALMVVGVFFAFYIAIPLLTLNWYAAYFSKAAEATSLGELEFGFDATTLQWLGLFLGNLALAVITLGFGITYWGYRNWSFMVRHMHIYGAIDVSDLTQSTTHAPREAEGFADAFDVGAI